ncbi:MAG: ABC transporter ATP-binding protein [Desertimonas sp.]
MLSVEDLAVYFDTPTGEVQAVHDVAFTIGEGETVGMVGESGSGKSVTALAIMRLLQSPPARITGSVVMDGRDLLALSESEMRGIRGREIGMIFQEPMTALDPLFTVGSQISETLRAHQNISRRAARRRSIEALDQVGIPSPARRVDEYPHQLSGGMRQRVMIAMALVCRPRLLIADEPTTAVDVTIQAQILELLRELNEEHGTAILMITHDLGVVAESCRRVITMYAGEEVETGTTDEVLEFPRHPYTAALLQAIPRVETRGMALQAIPGRVPALHEMPTGCRYRARCEHALERCVDPQQLLECAPDHAARCWRANALELPGAVR